MFLKIIKIIFFHLNLDVDKISKENDKNDLKNKNNGKHLLLIQ